MLVKRFKFRRNTDRGGFQWTAHSEVEIPGFYRGFHAVGKTLADVKEFAALVRWCERTGSLERLSEMHPSDFENRMQTTWGGNWYTPMPGTELRTQSRLRICASAASPPELAGEGGAPVPRTENRSQSAP